MSTPSSFLEASLTRWSDRGGLVRRDVEILLEGLEVKARYLSGLGGKIRDHRREDVAQLADARREAWSRWEERLKRLEEWMASAATLRQSTDRLRAWREAALGFDRAQNISQRYGHRLTRKAEHLEKGLVELGERMQRWSDRLALKEADLRGFIERQAVKTTEILVSSARKRPYLDFVYAEREEEGRLALEFKNLRGTTNRVLDRLARAEAWAAEHAKANPAQFDIPKNQLLNLWRPFQKRFGELREAVLQQALAFEEGRRRLRWIYEQVQQMRIVHESAPQRKPLLERLFHTEDQ